MLSRYRLEISSLDRPRLVHEHLADLRDHLRALVLEHQVHQLLRHALQALLLKVAAQGLAGIAQGLQDRARDVVGLGGPLLHDAKARVVEHVLVADNARGLPRKLNARLGRQAQERGPLVEVVDAQPVGHGVEVVVAGVGQGERDVLVLVVLGVARPASGRVGGLVVLGEVAQVVDLLLQGHGALLQAGQGRDPLEDGTGRRLGGDGAG